MDELSNGYRAKYGGYDVKNKLNGLGIGLNFHTLLIINLPDSRPLRIVSRSLFVAMIILALPLINSMIIASSDATPYGPDADLGNSDGYKILPILLRDLADEGHIRKGHRGFVPGVKDIEDDFEFLRDAGVDLLAGADQSAHRVFDFVYAPSFQGIQMVNDGIVKDSGLVISPLGLDPPDELRLLRMFKIVYLRQYENTVVAMRKTSALSNNIVNIAVNHVSCGVTPKKRKAALKGLEDVYLKPLRRSEKPIFTSRKIKYLPDLLKDLLDEYPRRVFISDDSKALD